MLKTHFVGDFAGATSATCARTPNYTQRRATTTDPDKVTCTRCLQYFAHHIEKARAAKKARALSNAQAALDRVADSMQRNSAQLAETIEKIERDAKISTLLDDERALRTQVHNREELTRCFKANAFKGGRVRRSQLKTYYESLDLLNALVARLNSVRGQLLVLSPAGCYATRTSDERIVFVTIPN